LGTGCATKKYVRNQVAPIDQRVTDVNGKTDKNQQDIAKLGEKEETDVSRVGETATSAENAARDAANAAKQADEKASQADQKASDAQTMAGANSQQIDRLHSTIQNIDNYELVSTEKVTFHFNSAMLTKDAKETLDTAVQNMSSKQHYVIEVQGFTDTSGSKSFNLALSQKRADAVVRYLMVEHHVPLFRIHMVGLGVDEPAADNHTRAGRQENRRVEIRTFAENIGGDGSMPARQEASPSAQAGPPVE